MRGFLYSAGPFKKFPPSSIVCVCVVYDAGQRFYSAQTVVSVVCELGIEEKVTAPLHSVTSPEEKRVIIGNTFMKVSTFLNVTFPNMHLLCVIL